MAVAGYQLKSDLARVCLPAPGRVASRRLAWANSISLVFLVIGVLGAQSRLPARRAVPPLEQPVAVIVEPLPPVPPPAAEQKPTEQQNESDKSETPHFQAVTMDTPAINFAVPTPGSLLVPMSVAPTPSEAPLKRVAPVRHEPATIDNTGNGGDRPAPPYPEMAKTMEQQGTVTLLVTVDDMGKVLSADIEQSSGSPILDDASQKWIKRHWIIPPANGGHVFRAPIHYVLQSN